MSVDYSLHLGHAFHAVKGKSRKKKLKDAMTALGVSILGGAITTGGASVFLLFCKIYLFVQLGVMMLMNTLTAFLYTLFGLCALLVIAGPTEHCVCLRICEKEIDEDEADVESPKKIELHLNPVMGKIGNEDTGVRSQNSWSDQ